MSYGVLASKAGQVLVESVTASGGNDADVVLDKFQTAWGGAWVPGRLTVTRLHLTFIANRSGQGLAMTQLALRDIRRVEVSGGPVNRVVSVRTARHVVRAKMIGGQSFAEPLARAVEQARAGQQRP